MFFILFANYGITGKESMTNRVLKGVISLLLTTHHSITSSLYYFTHSKHIVKLSPQTKKRKVMHFERELSKDVRCSMNKICSSLLKYSNNICSFRHAFLLH